MTLLSLWVLAITVACLSGWGLSIAGRLSCPGYVTVAACCVIGLWWWARPRARPRWRLYLARLRRRVRQPLPLVFGMQLLFAGIGGALYAPNNFDLLIYRFPRVLHWLAAGRWHWIPTRVTRMNYAGTVQEWVLSTMYACSQSDRAFFLLNLTGFALLPGLCFAVLRALGVRRHAAWVWMWLLPSAPAYAMQAGGGANDSIALVMFLAALHTATTRPRLSCLAAGLLTGIKASNLPLLLPWAIAWAPSWRLLARRPVASAVTVMVALIVSFAPTAVFNARYSGDWTGDPGNATQLRAGDPLSGLLGNTLQATFVNLAPPFLPHAPDISRQAMRLVPARLMQRFAREFPNFLLAVNELPQEDLSGLGLGVTALVLSCLVAAGLARNRHGPPASRVIAAGWVALIFPLTTLASNATARLLAPYYFLPIAGVLRSAAADRLARHRIWRAFAVLTSASTVLAIVLTPARPLFPATRLIALARSRFPDNAMVRRAQAVYARSARYPFLFAPALALVPPGSSRLGLIGSPESPLWRPYGTRVVSDIADTLQLDAFDGDAIVTDTAVLGAPMRSRIAHWRAAGRFRHIGQVTVPVGLGIGTLTWDVDVVQKDGPMDHRQ
jgi:hypothetical protein